MEQTQIKTVLVTGGAGYVGAVLVPRLLHQQYRVKVLDLYLYGDHVLQGMKGDPGLEEIKGDIRDRGLLAGVMHGCDAVIHLACISNDPSFELNPALGKSVNYDAFFGLVDEAKKQGVKRFIYASTSSVYGLKDEPDVTEDLPLEPLTDYSKYKALCEDVLLKERSPGFATLILRPATVCGYSPRQRLDLIVNILTTHAFHNRRITIYGGNQMRPNFHIEDAADLYVQSLQWPTEKIDGKIFNAGCQNYRVHEIAQMVREMVGNDVRIETAPTDDNRSYHISSNKIYRELGYRPKRTIQQGIADLVAAFQSGKIQNALTDVRYYNIKTMQQLRLQ